MLKKVNEKKVLHKVKKQWVVLGTALFVLGTAGAYSESAHADTVGDNHSSVVTSSAATPSSVATTTSKSADVGSSVANTSKNDSVTSSGATSGSSTETSSSTSASQPATTTLQTDNVGQSSAVYTTEDQDGISLRDGDGGNSNSVVASEGVRPTQSDVTNVSLVDSEPSNNGSLSASDIFTNSDNSLSIGMSISGTDNTIYHQGFPGNFIIQYANDGSNSQIQGIDNLVQHMQLSDGHEISSAADVSKYAEITSNMSASNDNHIYVSDANVNSIAASSVYQIVLSSGPLNNSEVSNYYYNGDKVWWTFNSIPNSNFNGKKSPIAYVISNNGSMNPITIQYMAYIDSTTSSNSIISSGYEISSNQWITGNNIYPGNKINFSVSTPNDIYGYEYSRHYSYSTNLNSNDGTNFSGTLNNNGNQVTFKYNKVPVPVSVTYFDSTANKNITVSGSSDPTSLSGEIGSSISYSTLDAVNSLAYEGYSLVSGSASTSLTVDSNSAGNSYVFNFIHKTSTYDANGSSFPSGLSKDDFSKSFTRTINFVDDNDPSKSVNDPVTQNVTYNRSGVYDEVTKSMSYGSWTADNSSFAEIAAPSVASYENPQPASIAAQSVNAPNSDGSDSTSSATSVTIKYTKSSGTPSDTEFSGTIRYIDSNDSNSSIIPDATIKGTSGAIVTDKLNGSDVDYSTQSVVDSLTSKGYKLVSGTPSISLTINSSNNDYTFTFVHKTSSYDGNSSSYPDKLTKDDFSKSFTRTINFVDSDTKQLISSAATQTVSYSRSAVYDEVTKSTSYSNWSTSDSSFDEYPAPSITGYKNPQPTFISASSVDTPDASGSDGTSATTSATISYTKVPSTSSSTTNYTPYVAPAKPASSSAVAGSDAPLIFYSASSSATSSSASTTTSSSSVASSSTTSSSASSTTKSSSSIASSSVASNAVPSSVPSSTSSSVATATIKMYNYKTELVKSNGQILIFIQPKYAPNDANGSLSNQFVVNQTLDNGQISHDQQVTLDQYNSMLVASGKQPYTPETLNQAYIDRNDYKGILKNSDYKTTFDASVVKQGNDVTINTNTQTNGFNKPADNKLVSLKEVSRAKVNGDNKKKTDKSKDKSKVKNQSKSKKQSEKKAKRAQKHVKKQAKEHNVTKHTHHVKHDRKQK